MADLTPNTHLSSGVLIKQPTAGDLRLETGSMQLIERWKGLYIHCQNVLTNMYHLSNDIDRSRFIAAAGELVQAYPSPNPPSGTKWTLAYANVDEIDAGENAILQCVWNASLSDEGEYPTSESWNLDWQPESYDVYAYCTNLSVHSDNEPYKSQRVAIEQCLHPPLGNNTMTTSKLFADNQGRLKQLNPNEQKILDWKLQDLHVIKHHPVLTKSFTVSKVKEKSLSAATDRYKDQMTQADVQSNGPNAIANAMALSGYTWVSQGTSIQTTQTDITKNEWQISFKTQWLGSLSVVAEFYGADRWKFGEM